MGKKNKKDRPCPNRVRVHTQRVRRHRDRSYAAVPTDAQMENTVYNLGMTIALLFLIAYSIFLVIWVLSS